MKDIFADIYNKVIGFFNKVEEEENSKDVARNRLKVVLMQDRTNINPQLMERMRKELVDLLCKYVEMDKEALELNLEQDSEQMALMLSIPVLRARDEEEIEAELAKEDSDDIIGKREAEEVEGSETEDGEPEKCECENPDCECDGKDCECDGETCDCKEPVEKCKCSAEDCKCDEKLKEKEVPDETTQIQSKPKK